jgi:hypothetical protein
MNSPEPELLADEHCPECDGRGADYNPPCECARLYDRCGCGRLKDPADSLCLRCESLADAIAEERRNPLC